MQGIQEIMDFMKGQTFFIATDEDGQPRVRPFGGLTEIDGRLYVNTGNGKDFYAQILKNPRVELCAFAKGTWLRIASTLVRDDSSETREKVLEQNPGLRHMYSAQDGKFEVLFLQNPDARFYAFGKDVRRVDL